MWRKKLMRGIAVLAVLMFAGASYAEPVLDQVYDPLPAPNLNALLYRGGYFAQTFTVGVTGTLTGVDVLVARQDTMVNNVLFDIRPTIDGVPIISNDPSGLLASAVINYESIPANTFDLPTVNKAFVNVDLASLGGVDVTAGDVLAIVMKLDRDPMPASTEHMWDMVWFGSTGDPYASGTAYSHPPIANPTWNEPVGSDGLPFDLAFRTYVEPASVPEPGTALLLGLGMLLTAARVLRHGKTHGA